MILDTRKRRFMTKRLEKHLYNIRKMIRFWKCEVIALYTEAVVKEFFQERSNSGLTLKCQKYTKNDSSCT